MKNIQWPLVVGAVVVGGVLLYAVAKKKPGESMAKTLGMGAVTAVGDAAAGAVVGLGSLIGIPETNTDQCSADIAAGRMWDASFSCPAGRFLSAINGQKTPADTAQSESELIDRQIEAHQIATAGLTGVYSDGEKTEQYDEMGNRIF